MERITMWSSFGRRAALGACVIVGTSIAACDGGSFQDCAITCTESTGCPSGFACGAQGYCRLEGAAGSCDLDTTKTCAELDCDDHDPCTIDACVAGPPAACQHDPVAVEPGTQTFASTGTLEIFTVPACVPRLTIEAFGAQGGTGGTAGLGGKGARVRGTFAVSGGMTLSVLVGGEGLSGSEAGGGGGGSFVWNPATPDLPLIAAGGGGGGANDADGASPGVGGVVGGDGTPGVGATSGAGTGGHSGATPTALNWAAGGAGWLTAGAPGGGSQVVSTGCMIARGGATARTGGSGGTAGGTGSLGAGGFGGGGGAQGRCVIGGGGGGGGFSGGGGAAESVAEVFPGGGGGGSYNAGTNPSNSPAARSGSGRVVISW